MIASICGRFPSVRANDDIDWEQVRDLNPTAIVLSPGPGRPGVPRDLGVSADIVHHWDGPLLGVCLGHQALAWAAGGEVGHAPEPWHGRIATVSHDGRGLFQGLPQALPVVRYHSLAVREPVPPGLEVTARSADGVIMGLRDRSRPRFGLQFHPESIGTPHGRHLIERFLRIAGVAVTPAARAPVRARSLAAASHTSTRVLSRHLDHDTDLEAAFCALFAGRLGATWLDSAGHQGASPSRFSVLGAADGPLGRVLTWRAGGGGLVHRAHRPTRAVSGTLVDHLRKSLRKHQVETDLPFDFIGGWVGILGYGCKAMWGLGEPTHRDTPDAAMAFIDRLVVVDHDTRTTWLVALVQRGAEDAARVWFNTTTSALAQLPPPPKTAPPTVPPLTPTVARPAYLDAVRSAQRDIVDGESYEVCLTQSLVTDPLPRPLDAYRRLRRLNPAPYGAFMDLPGAVVLSSSPEQFLRIDNHGVVQARPIKGTAPRHPDPQRDASAAADLQASEKDRAENLMIVDLLRHDLGRVCQAGTVAVPSLMALEPFATVHHLVSTITGTLRPESDALDAVVSAFPPGSMTGAPKERTVEILDALEAHPRGLYSGALGWLSANGTAELAVVIRTAVVDSTHTRVGVGGAITALSDPDAEWSEAVLKGRALDQALSTPAADLPELPSPTDRP